MMNRQIIDVYGDYKRTSYIAIIEMIINLGVSVVFVIKYGTGSDFNNGDENGDMMVATLCLMWTNIGPEARSMDQEKLIEALSDGLFTNWDRAISGITRADDGTSLGCLGYCFGIDGTDEQSLTSGMIEGRRKVLEFERFYREYMRDGYQNMKLCLTSPAPGVRETRRIVGDYV